MKVALLQLILTRGVGDVAIRRFCDIVTQSRRRVPDDGFCDSSILSEEYLFSADVARRIVEQRHAAIHLFERLRGNGIEMIWIGHKDYPRRLLQVMRKKSPSVLFLKGNRDILGMPGVGFCGARKASERGLSITEQCAGLVASRGFSVVSGYAVGVDERAHCAAMRSDGFTIMVLAEGILKMFEKSSVRVLENERNHLYVSQFSPECLWFAHNAMRRNDLILGLSKAMIVIEAGERGGSIAAGESSLNHGEPLYVVEYQSAPPTALGNKILLDRGARPIRSNRRGLPTLDDLFKRISDPCGTDTTDCQMKFDLC